MKARLTGTFKVEQLLDEIMAALPHWVGSVELVARDATGVDIEIPDAATAGETTTLRAVASAHSAKTEPTRAADRVAAMASIRSKLSVLGFTDSEIARLVRGS